MAVLPAGIEFDEDEEDQAPVATVRTSAPVVRSTLSAGRRETRASDRLVRDDEWTWEQLRDYVIRMIGETSGAHVVRDPKIEYGIFSAFIKRHGKNASRIAKWAFETSPHKGYWLSAPIRPTRFTKNADEYFADVILAKL